MEDLQDTRRRHVHTAESRGSMASVSLKSLVNIRVDRDVQLVMANSIACWYLLCLLIGCRVDVPLDVGATTTWLQLCIKERSVSL